MKRKFDHSAPAQRELNGPKYWRSLDELADTPGFREHLAREFPEGASSMDGVDRRQFMRLMAASFALGGLGLAGCRRPESHILPYGKSVEYTVPGLPLYFATAMPLRKSAIPLLAETHQGRPTKLEGNPTYAPHGGASSLLAQASVLDLYDPERTTTHSKGGATLSNGQVYDILAGINKTYAGNGEGLAFLADESASPTRARLLAKLKATFPRAIWAEYEPVQDEPPIAAAQAAFGKNVKPVYRFAEAKRIVSLDADFFHAEAGALYYAREFAKGRRVSKPTDEMNRLYVAESGFSLTGSMADHRLRIASHHMLALAAALAKKVHGDGAQFDPFILNDKLDVNPQWIEQCAQDLLAHKGESLVVAGAHQPAYVHTLAYAINAKLGNIGKTIDFVAVDAPSASTITALATAIKGGTVKTLIVLGGNPAYNAPADLDFGALLKSVPDVIRFGYYDDETSALAGTHLAATHYLESWGDARTVDGTIVPVQPMILPLFNGLSEVELLARLAGEENPDAYAQVFTTIGRLTSGDTKKAFEKFLHDGLLEGSAYPVADVSLGNLNFDFSKVPAAVTLSQNNLEVRFVTDHKMDDGRFANNGWLQECPDPMTKISWDNAILVSPRLGRELGIYPAGSLLQVARVEEADFVVGKENAFIGEVTVNGRTLRGPLHIQPGLSNYTIVLPLGYGRTASGHIGTGTGFDAYAIRTSDGLGFITGAKLIKTNERTLLANTQEHWSMEGRGIVREANFEEFKETPGFVAEIGMEAETPVVLGTEGQKRPGESEQAYLARIHGGNSQAVQKSLPRGNSLYETPNFTGIHQWGMSIDLNTCIGCNACIIACQAENNIPIVGKDQVLRGREMQWIRLDRYYSDGQADAAAFGADGNKILPEDPQVSMQPMTCQHCELAPCETVCPVNATVHDEEGINVMAYNRCIGTRYCANNCPYKVRRFNFFDFNKRATDALYMGPLGHQSEMPELVKMVKNPDVTVRMRGVMEKCTYCVQRVQQAKIAQLRLAGASGEVEIPDGTVKTACQQVCPVEAIVFGNIKDENSAVSRAKAQERTYAVLGYLNIRPRTTYLGKLRNPNPHMPDYAALPLSRVEYNKKNHPAPDAGSGAKPEKSTTEHGGNG